MVAKAFFFALVGIAFAQEPRPALLTHEQLKELLSKTTIFQFVRGTTRGTGVLAQDGTARLDGGSWAAKGTWRIDGNKYCSKYAGIRRGYETCYTLQKTGDNAYTLQDTGDGTIGTWIVER